VNLAVAIGVEQNLILKGANTTISTINQVMGVPTSFCGDHLITDKTLSGLISPQNAELPFVS